jgi:nucleolysin TIA-1/TIAR
MNGQWLGSKAIRTNWATRKPMASSYSGGGGAKALSQDEVSGQASETNTSVYCGGILNGISGKPRVSLCYLRRTLLYVQCVIINY